MGRMGRWVGALVVAILLSGGLSFGAPTPVTPQDSSSQPDDVDRKPEQERLPTSDPFQLFPFWLPKIQLVPKEFRGQFQPIFFYSDLHADSRNIVHKVWQECVLAPGEIEPPIEVEVAGASSVGGPEALLPSPGTTFDTVLTRADGLQAKVKVEVRAEVKDGNKTRHVWRVSSASDKPLPGSPKEPLKYWVLGFPKMNPHGVAQDQASGGIVLEAGENLINQDENGPTPVPVLMLSSIFYSNNRCEARGGDSFARTTFKLSEASEPDAEHPEIAVWMDSGGPDEIHAVWDSTQLVPTDTVIFTSLKAIRYRRFNRATNQWQPVLTLEDGEFPHVEVDQNTGIVHIVYIRREPGAFIGGQIEIRYIRSKTPFPATKADFFPSERVGVSTSFPQGVIGAGPADAFFPVVEKPRLAMGPEGEPYVGWVDRGSSFGPPGAPTESFLFTRRIAMSSTGAPWTDPIKVSEDRRAPSGDLAVAQAGGEVHWVWHDSQLDQIRHRRSGKFDDVKIVSRASGVSIPRTVVDSRKQVHVLYNIESSETLGLKQGYAARVNRPFDEVSPLPKWGRREPIETDAPNQMMELVLNQNDNLYATFSKICVAPETIPPGDGEVEVSNLSMPPLVTTNQAGGGDDVIIEPIPTLQIGRIFYSQTFEPNLGEQDAFGMFGWGPNSSANALNGNVFHAAPIFSSRGVGFSTNLSLIYNSLKWDKTVMNPGWMMNYLLILTDHNPPGEDKNTERDVINLVLGDGRRIVFRFNPAHGRHIAEDKYGYFSSIQRFAPGTGTLRDGTVVSYKMTTKFGIEYGFDASGRLVRIVDTQPTPNTFIVTYEDDPDSPPTETGDAGIVPTKLKDSPDGRQETELDYDSLDRLSAVKDPPDPRFGQRTFTIVYASGINGLNGGVKEIQMPEGVNWKFDYYYAGNNDEPPPDRQSEPDTGKERRNLLKKVATPRGNSFVYRYRQDNRAVEMQEPKEKHVVNETADADPVDFVATAKLSYEWPLAPAETPNTRRPHETAQVGVVFEPDQDEETPGQVSVRGNNVPETRFRDRRGFTTTIECQYARSLADNVEDPLGKHLVRIFNGDFGSRVPKPEFRNLTLFEDKGVNEEETKNETKYVYEAGSVPPWVKDNLEEIHRPGVSNAISYTYTTDGLNQVMTRTNSRGDTTTFDYDPAGNLTSIGHPNTTLEDGSIQLASEVFFYDNRGRTIETESAETGTTKFFYNDAATGLVTEVLQPLATKSEKFEYDVLGNTTKQTQPEGGVTEFVLDDLKRVVLQTDPTGDTGRSMSAFAYDLDSNLTSSTNGRGNSSSSTLDRLGRLSSFKNSLEDSMRFSYDREGNTRRREDFKGVRVSVSIYDALSRAILDERAGDRVAPLPSLDCPANEPEELPSLGGNAVVMRMSYDPNGNAIEVDQGGLQFTRHRFDSRNNLVKTTSAIEDITSVMFYDANDNLRGSISRGAGGEFRGASLNELDERNRLRRTSQFLTDVFSGEDESMVLPETFAPSGGLVTAFRYDRNNNRTGTRDPRGNLSRMTYDARDRVVDTLDARGFIISRFEYNENDLGVKVFGQDASNPFPGPASAAGNLVLLQQFEYNDKNELKKQTDASGDFVEFFYDENGNMVLQIDEAGVRRTSEYDVLDRLITQIEDEGPGRLNITTRFEYDANGNRSKIIDPRGFEYTFAFDQANRMIRLTYPELSDSTVHEEFWGYDRFGRMSFHLDANVKLACFEYDLLNRLVKETHGEPFEVEIVREYDTVGNLTRIDDGTIQTLFAYDGISRMTGVQWFIGGEAFRSLAYEYDAASNRTRMAGPEAGEATLYTYDVDNRPEDVSRTEPGGATTRLMCRHVYTSGGLLACKELGNGVHETRGYDVEQRLVRIHAFRTSDSATLTQFDYTYDERDDRTQVVLAHFNTTATFSYDAVQRLVRETWTGDISFFGEYGYDPNGNRLFKVNSQVGLRTYEYDEENRLIRETKSVQDELELTPSQVTVSSTAAGFTKDPITDGKISPQIKPGKAWKSEDLPGQQHFVEVSFDAPVLLNRITIWIPFDSKGKGKDEDEDHEAKHLLVQRFKIQAFVDGAFQDVLIEDLKGPQENTASPGWLNTRHFRNRIDFVPVFTSKVRFLQDAGGGSKDSPDTAVMSELRLRGFVSDADKAGEILYEYDANGNQIKRTEDGTEESFAYDYANRLAAYTKRHVSGGDGEGHGKGKGKGHDIGKGKGHDKDEDDDENGDGDGDGPGGIREAFTYLFAPSGERIAKRDIKRRRSEFYMYDGQDIVADYVPKKHGGFQVTVEYTNALSIDSKVARIEPGGGDRLFYHGDALNSVNALVDDAGQAENQQLTNAWGEPLLADQETADRYGFTQRENDPESGLMHLRGRSYDSRGGRFLQKDPMFWLPNLYIYAQDNPLRHRDPTGRQTEEQLMKLLEETAKDVAEDNPGLFKRSPKEFGDKLHEAFAESVKATEWDQPVSAEGQIWETVDGKERYFAERKDDLPEDIRVRVKKDPIAKPDVIVWRKGTDPFPGMRVRHGMADAVWDVKPDKLKVKQRQLYNTVFGVSPKALPYRPFLRIARGAALGILAAAGALEAIVEGPDPAQTPFGRYVRAIDNLDPKGMYNAGLDIIGALGKMNAVGPASSFMAFDRFMQGEVSGIKTALAEFEKDTSK